MDTNQKMVLVEWIDAEDPPEGGWLTEEVVEKFSKEDCVCYSVGWVKSQTERYITLYADISPNPDTYSRVTKIPMKWVSSIKVLEQVPSNEELVEMAKGTING